MRKILKNNLLFVMFIILSFGVLICCSSKKETVPEETYSERMERARQQRDDVVDTLDNN